MRPRARRAASTSAIALLVALCAAAWSPSPPASSSTDTALPSAGPSVGQGSADQLSAAMWSEDVEALDAGVRQMHPNPFVNHSEQEWKDGIAALESELPEMSREDATVALMRQVALLDTHSGIFPEESGFHVYPLVLYRFSDGPTVIGATDPDYIGASVTAIGSTPIDTAMERLRPLVNADNDSGYVDLVTYLIMVPEILHSLSLVADTSKPQIALTLVDGTATTVDLEPSTIDAVYGDASTLEAPQTVPASWAARGQSEISWSVDGASKSIVVSYNNVGADASGAIAAIAAAIDDHEADRVVLDMRYARGGSYDGSLALVQALKADPRINSKDHLVVIIGRECVSAATTLAATLDRDTAAVFVGEPTPARADNFLNEQTFLLPNSGLTVHVPTTVGDPAAAGDSRDAVYPDVAVATTSAEFLAGKDPVLEAALKR